MLNTATRGVRWRRALSALGFFLVWITAAIGDSPLLPGPSDLQLLSNGILPSERTNFVGLIDNYTAIPPDTQGAVGPEHLMVVLNTEVAIQNRRGKELSRVSLRQFWDRLKPDYVYDPRVLYHPHIQRWIAMTLANPRQTNSAVFVGISTSADPTKDWYLFSIEADPQHLTWADYPNLGFNSQWIAASVNIYLLETNLFRHSEILVFPIRQLTNNSLAVSRFRETNVFNVVPAVTCDADEERLYLATEYGTSRLRLSRIEGDPEAPRYRSAYATTTPVPEWLFQPGLTNFLPQLGSDTRIYANDSRLHSVVLRNGKIWCAHHVFVSKNGNPHRCAVQWWQLNTSGGILQRGRIEDDKAQFHYAFPSLAVNKSNDVLIGYSRFGSNQYASANYSYRLSKDPANTLRSDTVLRIGQAPYMRLNTRGRNSWGDFSSTVVDPLNDMDLWTFQEYAELPGSLGDRWGTWWGYLGFQTTTVPLITASPQSQVVTSPSQTIHLSVAAIGTEPFRYQWRREGTNLPAATNAVLTFIGLSADQQGTYDVIVRNAAGYSVSDPAVLRLQQTTPPQLSQSRINLNSQFEMAVSNTPGDVLTIEASTNLIHWNTAGVITNTTGYMILYDPASTNYLHRFYRARYGLP
ncbi:MAG TPA: immunoglobulin domain-containing protein [Candidatus Paceibacterota bacterium]|nr:immunoglobulin domain-containing protein [Verrucomicrobiota bacterium]HRY48874.1 immunoglobulin domain-containing protein [Candidatus Paceibacterota bacterium]